MYQINYYKKNLPTKHQTKKILKKKTHFKSEFFKSRNLSNQDLLIKKRHFKKHLKIYPQNQNYLLNYSTFLHNNVASASMNVFIKTTLNNMFVTYSFNNKIITKSIAAMGFKGKAKQTSYAYKAFAEATVNDLINLTNLNTTLTINLYAKSLNYKLKTFFHIFKLNHIKINKFFDITPIPYNGCRKKKISIKKKKNLLLNFYLINKYFILNLFYFLYKYIHTYVSTHNLLTFIIFNSYRIFRFLFI